MITIVMIMTHVMTTMMTMIREGIEEGKKEEETGINIVIIRLPHYVRSNSGSLQVCLLPKYVRYL